MIEWFNNSKRKDNERTSRTRRIYSFNGSRHGSELGSEPRTAYLAIDEFRSGDSWKPQRDRLRYAVERQLLSHSSIVSVGTISYWRVWAAIIPSVAPSHWVTAGYRSTENKYDKVPVIQFPASLGNSEGVIHDLAEPMAWAIDALPLPPSLQLEKRERSVFSLTLLSALSIAVRDQMTRH